MYVVTVFSLDKISKVYTVDTGLLWVNCYKDDWLIRIRMSDSLHSI